MAASASPSQLDLDTVLTIPIRPGSLRLYGELACEGGPLVKCVPGSLTLVSPGRAHESAGERLGVLVVAVCSTLEIPLTLLGSSYFELPAESPDFGYMPDKSFYLQNHGKASEGQPPDLAIEVVVSHPTTKALQNGLVLGIPEMWVWHASEGRLVIHHLRKHAGGKRTYASRSRSRALPFLSTDAVRQQLDVATDDDCKFDRSCREWAARVLAPKFRRARGEGGR